MSKLSPTALRKYDRIDIFRQKIKSGSTFQMESGSLLIVSNIQHNFTSLLNIQNNLGYAPFIMGDGTTATLSSFTKTDEFGGKQISGAGSDLTSKVECLQCYYNANTMDNHSYLIEHDINEIHDEIPESWHKSAIIVANMLASHIEHPHEYEHHKGSYLVKSITSKFSELNKKLDDPFNNINKWNPSDIWIVNKDWDIDPMLHQSESIQQLNENMYSNYVQGNLIGVSLKKVSKFGKITAYNTPDMELDISYTGYTVTKSEFLNDSIDAYVHYEINGKPGKIQFRPFNVTSSWQGEVKGIDANHGKIGEKKLSRMFEYRLTDSNTVISNRRNEQHLTRFHELATLLYDKVDISLDEFITKIVNDEVSDSYMLGKFKGLELVDIINNESDQNAIVDKMIRYAISATEHSSVFLKIGE